MRGGAADLEATALASTAAAVSPASSHGRLLRRLAWIGWRRDAVFGGNVIWLWIGGGVEGLVDCLTAPMADLFWPV